MHLVPALADLPLVQMTRSGCAAVLGVAALRWSYPVTMPLVVAIFIIADAVYEILPEPPELVVSGINYGENLGTGITVSGTVGAALEAASR